MKVIGYCRVSTEEQASEGVSLAAQEAKVRAYAALHDLELVEVIVDAGVSAKNLKRPGLIRALAMLKKGTAAGLVIAKMDRLSRSVKDWNSLIDGYFGERAGKVLMSVNDSIDTRTAAGRLVLNVLMSVAQWEREAIGERVHEALAYKKTKGERVGQIPLGKRLAVDGVTLLDDEAEQAVIARVVALKALDLSHRKIAAALNAEGLKPKGGGQWYATTVRRALQAAPTMVQPILQAA